MSNFKIQIDNDSPVPKYKQLADVIVTAINKNELLVGDALPSVNQIIESCSLSRDTVVKGYSLLKKKGVIESYPKKGFFVSGNTSNVLFFIDTYKAYKEVLYHAFYDNLPKEFNIDLNFHHYDIDIFEQVISRGLGMYSKYVIMSFQHPRVNEILAQIEKERLLLIDWNINSPEGCSHIIQDFGKALYSSLETQLESIIQYKTFHYIYPNFTYHPAESVDYFKSFCQNYGIKNSLIHDPKMLNIEKGGLYLTVSDRMLAKMIEQANEKGLVIGEDIGIISYNETPMKKYIHKGISVISTDFDVMGKKAAEFVVGSEPMMETIGTEFILRSSV